jgi:hypothetical protein
MPHKSLVFPFEAGDMTGNAEIRPESDELQ